MINEIYAHKFCRDDISKIENYEAAKNDKTKTWHLHHRLELTLDGEFALSVEQLIMHDMYYDRPYYELIFLTQSEHLRMHSLSKARSDESKRKKSESLKGRTSNRRGVTLSDETKRKISDSMKGRTLTEEHRIKLSEAAKGSHRSEVTKRKLSESHKCKHLSEDTKRKLSESLKGRTFSEESRKKMSEAAKRRHRRINNITTNNNIIV